MIMLDILRKNEIVGTFFIHHKVALKYPVLVRKIRQEGHEIGCLIDTPYHRKSYQQIAQLAVEELEEIIGGKIIGIRSRGLHILNTNFDLYCKILNNIGIQYDSSLITNKKMGSYEKKNSSLAAFHDFQITEYPQARLLSSPLSRSKSLPFGSKAFRLIPYEVNNLFVSRLNKYTSVFTISVYDLGLADYASTKANYQLSTSNKLEFLNRASISPKLHKLFGDYPFDSFANYYRLQNMQNR